MSKKQKINFVKRILNDTDMNKFLLMQMNKDGMQYILYNYNSLIRNSTKSVGTETMGECCVCMENKSVFPTECDHPICYDCIVKIDNKKCPLCRQSLIEPHTDLF